MTSSNYKIKFTLASPICFIDRPVFDSLLAYGIAKEQNPGAKFMQARSLPLAEMEKVWAAMPLDRHQDGWFYASWMQWDKAKQATFTGSWKKRWASEHDHLADFGKRQRKIAVSRGPYKSYDTPLNLHNIPEVWFYFRTSNLAEVERLIDTHIWSLGKKGSQGYGEIFDFRTEEVSEDPFTEVIRPMPAAEGEPGQYIGMMPPYWEPQNMRLCKLD